MISIYKLIEIVMVFFRICLMTRKELYLLLFQLSSNELSASKQ